MSRFVGLFSPGQRKPRSTIMLGCILFCFVVFTMAPAMAQTVIVHNDFEDGSAQGWAPRGSVSLTNSTVAAHGGLRSLLTTGRTATWNGPSLNATNLLTPGAPYQISVWVQLVSGQSPDTLKLTMQRTTGGTSSYDTVATSSSAVTDSAWVQLKGIYTLAAAADSLQLYVEGGIATTQFYIDDFDITQIPASGCSVPQDNSGIQTDFEANANQGWGPRGSIAVATTNADAHSGVYSLLTTGRTSSWNGPSINVANKLCNGSRYTVVVWVKMAPSQPDTQLRVSIQRSFAGTTNYNTIVGNTTVTSGAWVRLKATFDFVWNYDSVSMYVESNNNPTASFYIDDFSLTYQPPLTIQTDIPSLRDVLADDFLIGGAVRASGVAGVHGQLLAKHFSSLTSENDMKWDATEPTEGTFNLSAADAQVAFAKSNNIKVRGHALVWGNQTPNWVFQDASGTDMSTLPYSDANRNLLLQRMQNHIRTLIKHFGADIYAWDVVNEPFDESQPDGYKHNKWFLIYGGPGYIDKAFEYAKQAVDELQLPAGTIKLYLNEYSTNVAAKQNFMLAYLADAKQRGVPIDGVGHQFHYYVNWPINDDPATMAGVVQTINAFGDLGYDNQITEMDVSIYPLNDPTQPIFTDYSDIVAFDQPMLIMLGYRYRDYFQIFRKLKDKISSVTVWGLADDITWKTSSTKVDAPLLFDDQLKAKYAYWGIVDPLQLPGADLQATITADSSSVLSGKIITYTITVTNNGHDAASNVVLTDAVPAGTVLQSFAAPGNWTCTIPAIGSTGQISCAAASMDSGTSAQFTLTVQVPCVTQNGVTITNTASVVSDTRDPNPEPNNAASVIVQVSNPPPVIAGLSANPPVLWPPNNWMRFVTLSYNVSDNCDARIVPAIAITSNQVERDRRRHPEVDWMVIDPHHVFLRAEIDPFSWRGRTYTITLTATDSYGYSSNSSVDVDVLNLFWWW